MAVTRADVEKLDSKSWSQLPDNHKDELLNIAERQASDIYGGDVSTLSIIEGNRDDFVKYLAAHLWELAEGGEAQSESSTGGSVNYNTVTGNPMSSLTETRFGRVAQEYVRDESGIGLVRTY
jgi:hypothetical protein